MRDGNGATTPDHRLDLRFFPAPPEFEGCFTTFYRMDLRVAGGGTIEDALQPEWANLRVFQGARPTSSIRDGEVLSGTRLIATGPSSRPNHFSLGTTRMWGIGLLPLGWARFVGCSAAELANSQADAERDPRYVHFAPLAHVFDGEPDDEAEFARIVALFRALDRPVADQDKIRSVHAAMVETGLSSVAEFAEHAGLGVRSLERLSRRYFGFPPKLLLRRQRFMRSLAAFMLAGEGNWSSAIDELYHDQSHFTRDFRAFMGMCPREYAALPHPILSAFMAERARVMGSAAQTLDPPARPLR
jgi:AraC-like DNA-binding protein